MQSIVDWLQNREGPSTVVTPDTHDVRPVTQTAYHFLMPSMPRSACSATPVLHDSFLLPMRIRRLEDGSYLGRASTLPGLNVQADTVEEVLRLAPKIAKALIEAMRAKGVKLPATLATLKPTTNVHLVVAA